MAADGVEGGTTAALGGADEAVSAPPEVRIPFKDALLVALSAGIGYGFDAYAVNIYSLVLPLIAVSLGLSLGEQGLIGSIFLVGYTIGTIGFGMAADRFGMAADRFGQVSWRRNGAVRGAGRILTAFQQDCLRAHLPWSRRSGAVMPSPTGVGGGRPTVAHRQRPGSGPAGVCTPEATVVWREQRAKLTDAYLRAQDAYLTAREAFRRVQVARDEGRDRRVEAVEFQARSRDFRVLCRAAHELTRARRDPRAGTRTGA